MLIHKCLFYILTQVSFIWLHPVHYRICLDIHQQYDIR